MWRQVAQLSGGTAIGQGLVVLATPVLTRLYAPDAFGQFGLYLSFASVAAVFVGLRYDLAIASSADQDESDELLAVALVACVPTSVLAGVLLWLMIGKDVLGFGALPAVAAPVVTVLLFATGIVMSLRHWNVRGFRFREVAGASAFQGGGRALVPLLLALASPGWWGLLAGDAAGRVLGAARLARGAAARLGRVVSTRVRSAAWRHWRYPAVMLPSSLIDSVSAALPLPLISMFFGVSAAGQFALVQRVAAVPASLVAASFADVVHAEGSRLRESGEATLRTLCAQSARRLGLVGLAVYLPVLVLAPAAFPLLFGPEWLDAGHVAAVLAPFLGLTLIVSPVSRLILVAGRMELKLLADVVRLLLPPAALFAARDFDFTWAMAAFGAASVVANLFYLAVIWFAVGHARGPRGYAR